MKRWEWLGPAVGATFYTTSLTFLFLDPFEEVFFGFSDPIKFLLTIVAVTVAFGIVARVLQKRRRRLREAKAQLAAWSPPDEHEAGSASASASQPAPPASEVPS